VRNIGLSHDEGKVLLKSTVEVKASKSSFKEPNSDKVNSGNLIVEILNSEASEKQDLTLH